jgi:hypothetical protein
MDLAAFREDPKTVAATLCGRKINAGGQQIRQPVFNRDHVQKRQPPVGSEFGYDVHIRQLVDSRPPRV